VCRGVFEDGTPFSIPEDGSVPVLDIPPQTKETLVYLTLPLPRDDLPVFSPDNGQQSPVRYLTDKVPVSDNNADAHTQRTAVIAIARPRLRLCIAGTDLGAFTALPLLRIAEVRADKTVILADNLADNQLDRFIPPCLDCRAVPHLHGFIEEIHGKLQHRSEALAELVRGGGTDAIHHLFQLQAVNQFEPLYGHLAQIAGLHPEDFFRVGLQTLGVLASHLSKGRRPAALPPYQHHDLQACFAALMTALRGYLGEVPAHNVIPIPLKDVGHGIRRGIPPDPGLFDTAEFILAAKADMKDEALRQGLPTNIKIGPVERIAELVNRHLRGIPLHTLPVKPPPLPFHRGFAYFELDKTDPLWKSLKTSGGIAFFADAGFPGLDLELWAIRSEDQ
jgi:type VI secretion system protein ImpJ